MLNGVLHSWLLSRKVLYGEEKRAGGVQPRISSFGGAVVISAGALSENIAAVVAMSSQTYGTDLAPRLSPRPLLVLHGTADEILLNECSENIYARAREPKQLKLYPGYRHGLDECQD